MDILKPWQEKVVGKRMEAIQKVEARLEGAPKGKKTAILEEVSKESNVTRRTLATWIALKKDGGNYALVPLHGLSQKKILDRNPEMGKYFLDLVLKKRGLNPKEAIEKTARNFQDRYEIPSTKTFYNFLYSRVNRNELLNLQFPEIWNRRHAPYVMRNWDECEVN